MLFFRYCLGLTALAGVGLALFGATPPPVVSGDGDCAFEAPPEYYEITLIPTRRVPGARRATGAAAVTFTPSPFGISISPKGHYVYNLDISIQNLPPAGEGAYVAWASTSDLDAIKRLGSLDEQMTISGQVAWNKFLVIVTLEPSAQAGDTWQGPVVLRGMSRSGRMHTMAGHGPFQQEPCANFGYN
jgi:hypothetical protein